MTVATLIESWLLCVASRPNGVSGLTEEQKKAQKKAEGLAEQAVAEALREVGPVRYGRRTFFSSLPARTSAVHVLYDEDVKQAEDVEWNTGEVAPTTEPEPVRADPPPEKIAGYISPNKYNQ